MIPLSLYFSAGASGEGGRRLAPPQKKLSPWAGLWLAMRPQKLSLAPYLPNSGASTALWDIKFQFLPLELIQKSFPTALRSVQETYPNFQQHPMSDIG